jgi:hypothetical protein
MSKRGGTPMRTAGPLPRCELLPLGGQRSGDSRKRGGTSTTRIDRHEEGSALFVVMVLLLTMVWFAVSAFRISSQQVQMVGNAQAEQHATAAAQRAIDLTISSNQFTVDPATVAAIPISTDVDGDGKDDFTARLTPQPKCIRVRPLKTMELDITKASDLACLQSSGSGGNLREIPGTPVASGNSLCANSEWDIGAAVDDPASNTAVTVHQGVAIRVARDDAASFCK